MDGAKNSAKQLMNDAVFAFLTAAVICLLLFPDAIFLKAGLSQTSQYVGAQMHQPTATFYPQPAHRIYLDAYSDAGGALHQSEPAIRFLRNCLKTGETAYWNPYSGAGQLGPETLVDLKFSFQSLLIALLDGTETAFNTVLIGSYFVGTFALYWFCIRFLKVSKISATAACFAYAFCGYNTATLGTNTSQTYIYYPVLLCALAFFSNKPSTVRLILLTLVDIIFLSATFMPTCFLTLLTAHLIGLSYAWSLEKYPVKSLICLATLEISALIFAILGLGFLYFPIIESFFYVDAVSMYNNRKFFHANHNGILSLFTSKHFWEDYCAIPAFLYDGAPHNKSVIITNSMYHFGAVASIIAACSVVMKGRLRPIGITCILLIVMTLGRIFETPVVNQIISFTPGLRSLGEQYLFSCTACAYVVAVAIGMEAVKNSLPKIWIPALLVVSVIFSATAYLYFSYGFIAPNIQYKQLCVSILCATTLSAFALILFAAWKSNLTNIVCSVLVVILSSELIFDIMYLHFRKTEHFHNPSIHVQLLKQQKGLWRLVNLNAGVMPAEQGSAYQIQQVETTNMNILPTYESFFHRHFVNKFIPPWGRFCNFFMMVEKTDKEWKPMINMPMLDLLGTRYISVPFFWFKTRKYLEEHGCERFITLLFMDLYKNPNAFPRAFATSHIANKALIDTSIPRGCRSIVYSTDRMLLIDAVEMQIPMAKDGEIPAPIPDSACTISDYHNDSVEIKTSLPSAGVIVLTDNYHPNWSATVDGKPAHIGLVDETFRGVVVPKGQHTIRMQYRPKTLTAGIFASLSTLILLLMGIIFRTKLDTAFMLIQNQKTEPKTNSVP